MNGVRVNPRWLWPLACTLTLTPFIAQAVSVSFKQYATGVSSPVGIVDAGDSSGRLFVVEQAGRIRVVRNGVVNATPYVDLSSRLIAGGEMGLLGLAFHPRFAQNGFVYVYYTAIPAVPNGASDIVIARLTATPAADTVNASTLVELLRFPHPQQQNHDGGSLVFGPDGLLYAGSGDGGGGGDPFQAAQNLNDLRGKILRLDVDLPAPYIPASNPFANQAGRRGEIFAYGLRNPWRISFDRLTGDLFIADVGQGAWEEVSMLPAGSAGGQNLGWSIYEGNHCYPPSTPTCSLAGHHSPIIEYTRTVGSSITGGYRYRGHRFPELVGEYVFGDYGSGRVFTGRLGAGGAWTYDQGGTLPVVTTFGQDIEGELYAARYDTGVIYRITPPDDDDDGMSNAFEAQHFGSPTAGDPSADGDNDGIPNLQEYREGRNPAAKDNDVFAVPRLFAMQQYRDFLAREGESLGVEFWAAQVAGGMPRYAAIDFFLRSPEFEGLLAPVVRLYFAYFLRIPDYAGLNFWLGSRRSGTSLDAISANFAGSAEFQSRYGSLDNAQFVTLIYQNVLGRPADAQGQAFWTAELDSGRRTRGQVMLYFSESAEYRAPIANEVYVTMAYTGMLRRAPDQGGFDFWVNHLDTGNSPASLIDGFYNAPEYRSRFLP